MKRASITYDEAVVSRLSEAYGTTNIASLVRLLLSKADYQLAVDRLYGRLGTFGTHDLERSEAGKRSLRRRSK